MEQNNKRRHKNAGIGVMETVYDQYEKYRY